MWTPGCSTWVLYRAGFAKRKSAHLQEVGTVGGDLFPEWDMQSFSSLPALFSQFICSPAIQIAVSISRLNMGAHEYVPFGGVKSSGFMVI